MKSLLDAEIKYDDIIAHWDNLHEWEGYKTCVYIAINIPREIPCSVDYKIWSFTNNYQKECAIAEKLGLQFYDETHEYFHTGGGLPNPDFKDKNGNTYELKNTKKYSYSDRHWWGADYHLYYDDVNGVLYKQNPDSTYTAIADIKIEAVKKGV